MSEQYYEPENQGIDFKKESTLSLTYFLNGNPLNVRTMEELTKQMRADGFGNEAEVSFNSREGTFRVTQSG